MAISWCFPPAQSEPDWLNLPTMHNHEYNIMIMHNHEYYNHAVINITMQEYCHTGGQWPDPGISDGGACEVENYVKWYNCVGLKWV